MNSLLLLSISFSLLALGTCHDYIIGFECKPEPVLDRVECGYAGISEADCIDANCCYNSTTPGAVDCFTKTAITVDVTPILLESMKNLTDKVEQQAKEIEDLRASHANDIQAIRSDHSSDMQAVRTEHGTDIQAVRSELANGMQAVRSEHAKDVTAQQAVNDKLNRQVAFMASYDGSCNTVGVPIPYGNNGVSINLGGGFTSPRFRAPYSGLYQFSWSFLLDLPNTVTTSRIYVDGSAQSAGTFMRLWDNSHSRNMATQMAVISVSAGSSVDVRLTQGYARGDPSYYHAVFSGVMIRQNA